MIRFSFFLGIFLAFFTYVALEAKPLMETGGPVSVISGANSESYHSSISEEEARVKVQVNAYRTLIQAYIECKEANNIGFISIPKKESVCKRQEFQPRGSHLGTCSFGGTMTCVSRHHLDLQEEDRIHDAMDLIDGSRTLIGRNGNPISFEDLETKLKK